MSRLSAEEGPDQCLCVSGLAERNPMCPRHGRSANYHKASHQCSCGKRLPLEVWKRKYVNGVAFCGEDCEKLRS